MVMSKDCFYKEVSLQIDTMFYNTSLLHLNLCIIDFKIPLKTHGKNMMSVFL
jgi:hypothetical protein